MRHAIAPAVVASLALFAAPAAAQHTPATQIAQEWVVLNYQGPLGGRFSLVGDAQYRAWDDGTPQSVILRNALTYRIAEGVTVGLGYMWTPGWRGHDATNFFDEHRVYENFQYQLTEPRTGLVVQLRSRLEQRLRYPTGRVELGLRARQMLRLALPIALRQRLTLVAWDEVFFNLTNAGAEPFDPDANGAVTRSPQWEFAGFDQNRAFLGLGYQLVPRVFRVELGYLNQYVRRPNNPNNGGDLAAHTALLQMFVSWN